MYVNLIYGVDTLDRKYRVTLPRRSFGVHSVHVLIDHFRRHLTNMKVYDKVAICTYMSVY